MGQVRYLNAADQIVEEMLTGWRRQQLARNLGLATIDDCERVVRRFLDVTNELPWLWTPAHVDEYFGDLRSIRGLRRSTIRGYQNALSLFCSYLVDPSYGWGPRCEELFGTHPVVGRIRENGRKGWLAALRDSVVFKTAYAYGLRRNEVRHLRVLDFGRNPHAREFGRYGAVEVRFGKAHKGSAHKRRTVLTVFDWSLDVLTHWIELGLVHYDLDALELFPSERGTLVSESALTTRFGRYRSELGLDPALDMHSFRRSYATDLIERGFDPLFVQKQLGHEHASTTAIYEFVSDDYRRSMLRHALDSTIGDALQEDSR